MARKKGTFQVSANYEPLKAAPFDARSLVETRADLIAESSWVVNDIAWVYNGMLVSVGQDIEPSFNGVYILQDAENYTDLNSWKKLADTTSIEDLQKQIDELEVSGGGSLDVEVETEDELPAEGNDNTTYYIKENSSIQRWDEETQSYISYGGVGETPELDINLIFGGNSNGND